MTSSLPGSEPQYWLVNRYRLLMFRRLNVPTFVGTPRSWSYSVSVITLGSSVSSDGIVGRTTSGLADVLNLGAVEAHCAVYRSLPAQRPKYRILLPILQLESSTCAHKARSTSGELRLRFERASQFSRSVGIDASLWTVRVNLTVVPVNHAFIHRCEWQAGLTCDKRSRRDLDMGTKVPFQFDL